MVRRKEGILQNTQESVFVMYSHLTIEAALRKAMRGGKFCIHSSGRAPGAGKSQQEMCAAIVLGGTLI